MNIFLWIPFLELPHKPLNQIGPKSVSPFASHDFALKMAKIADGPYLSIIEHILIPNNTFDQKIWNFL